MLDDALGYYKRGLSIIPVRQDKKPMLPWEKYQRERAPEDQIREWWKKWPSANIGLVTGSVSGICVIDVDKPEVGIPELMKIIPDEPMPTVGTPRGGQHFYFQAPTAALGNNAGTIPGCDFRGQGGYVVAPPSVNGNGATYHWLVDLDHAPLRPLPEPYIQRVKNGSSLNDHGYSASSREHSIINTLNIEECRHNDDSAICTFAQGRRDEDLFHVANCLVKGGMPASECLKVLELLAKSCNPPFPEKELFAKIESAIQRVARRDRSLAEEIREWVVSSNGVFSSSDIDVCRQVSSREERKNISKILSRLCEEGLIERYGNRNGCFRRIDTECEDIDFLHASTECLHILWPFTIERYFRTLPKNIIVLAGQSDSGKTAFLLNFVRRNMHEHQIYYFSSEMGPVEFRDRLSKFSLPLSDWRFTLKERSSNFADVIKPDAVNVIDFLELHDDFYRVGGAIKDIFDRLHKGIAVIAIQKNAGSDYGLGGARSLEKARLYLSMEPGKVKIVKAKNWACSINPNRQECEFKIVNGCEFHTETDWHKEGAARG